MHEDNRQSGLDTLNDIRSMMERSSRFLSLSGWSGIWAGVVALAGVCVMGRWEQQWSHYFRAWDEQGYAPSVAPPGSTTDLLLLAAAVFGAALLGSFFFTWRKTRQQGGRILNTASKRLAIAVAIPFLAGVVFCLHFLFRGAYAYLVPASLAFYGLALVNGSKYTLSEIKYLGYTDLVLGCISLFFPKWGLYFWAAGFGLLHIVYGISMWYQYDRRNAS